jgi:3-hydroxyacyl-CoA dehydrogenase
MTEIQRITVVGAGTMGHGIAGQAARCGFRVVLNDVAADRVEAGLQAVRKSYATGLAKGKLTAEQVASAEAALRGETDLERAVSEADLVVEAVPENMELKRALFGRFEAAAPRHALLASNTSSLSITEIAASTQHPQRVIGRTSSIRSR